MQKKTKFLALLLSVLMVLTVSATALAAGDDGSVTISNATKGEDYAVYKVFDLTYNGDAVAYSYTKNGDPDALLTALTSDDSPFTLTETTTPGVYNVSLKENKTGADVSSFLKTNEAILPKTAGPVKADSSTVTFSNLPYGYYYITSSLGTVASIDSAKKDVTVIDKNQKPGWDPEDPKNPDGSGETGKFVATAADGEFAKSSTAAINDTAYFKVNAYAPKYAGDKQVADYIFTDTLGDGFTFNDDLVVKLGDKTLTKDTDYTVAVEGQKITVTVKAGEIADYPAVDAHLSITYSAKVDENAVYDNVNNVAMDWTVYPNDPDTGKPDTDKPPYNPTEDPDDPNYNPDDPKNPSDSKTDTYVFGFNLQKYKTAIANENKLEGAKFKLYDAATGGNEIPLVKNEDGTYRVASAEERAADNFVSAEIEAGTAQIFGLDAKTYYLEETVAPDGYNKLTERVEVAISDAEDAQTNGIQNAPTEVINNAGAMLPSTGGIGTTIFYILGGALLVGAVVLLVVKKRMRDSNV